MAKKSQKIYARGERIGLTCDCGRFVDGLTPDIKSVKCWVCVAREAAPPEQRKPKQPKYDPRDGNDVNITNPHQVPSIASGKR